MASNLFDWLGEQNNLSGLQSWAAQNFGESNPALAQLAQSAPRSFQELLPNLLKQQMEGQAIQQYYGGNQKTQTVNPIQQFAEGNNGDMQASTAVPQTLPTSDGLTAQPQQVPVQDKNSALAKMSAIAYLPPALQQVAAQQMMVEGMGGGGSNLTGQEYLSTLSPAWASRVQGVIEGRVPYPAANSRSPQDVLLKQMVAQAEPSFDASAWQQRSAIQKSLASGTDAQNIAALNTAMSHLGNLQDAYKKLNNSDYPSYNYIANLAGNQLGNKDIQSNTAAVSTDARATAHELAKVFRQSGMSEGEVKDWENSISTNAAPASSDQIIQSAMDLMEGRLSAVANKVNSAIPGANKSGIDFLSPEGHAAYNKIRGLPPDQAIAQGNPSVLPPSAGNQSSALSQLSGSPNMPSIQVPSMQPPEQNALSQVSQQRPKIYVNPQTGQRITKQNGKWVPVQ